MRLILAIIITILWLLFGIYVVQPCFITACGCGTTSTGTTVQPPKSASSENTTAGNSNTAAKVTGPLLFSWNNENAILGDGWDARRKAILDGLSDDEKLEITGQYRADEDNSTSFENLGLARANEIAKLLKPPLTDDRIQIRGQLVNAKEAEKTSNFKSVSFRNLKNTAAIQEIDDMTRIYFPFNSVERITNPEIETYLNDVADRVKRTGERVRLTGHTDNVDSESFNQALGLKRANIVRKYLIDKGVDPSKIISQSKGELQPLGDNSTKEGRAKNRRTVLEIIK